MLNQEHLVKKFREEFPTLTFKEISKRTGINTTRIFRLFNGHEMRVSEYQAIEKLLNKNPLEAKASQCRDTLPTEQLEKINSILERYLDSYLLAHDASGYYSRQQERGVS